MLNILLSECEDILKSLYLIFKIQTRHFEQYFKCVTIFRSDCCAVCADQGAAGRVQSDGHRARQRSRGHAQQEHTHLYVLRLFFFRPFFLVINYSESDIQHLIT